MNDSGYSDVKKRQRSTQLVLDLPVDKKSFSRENFIITPGNETAVPTLDSWKATTESFLAICGPRVTGKSHLAFLLAESGDAEFFNVGDSELNDIASAGPILIIDQMELAPNPQKLLALLETLKSSEKRIVLVGAGAPGEWAKGLRDLKTRLESMPRITMMQPDEELLSALIAKLFRDRQLQAPANVIEYAAPRLPKTFAAARRFVAEADYISSQTASPIGLGIARSVIDNLSEEEFEG